MADVLNFSVNRVFDINGDPVPGARASFFTSGTSTARTVYADPEGAIPHPSPLIANIEGVFPPVYSTGGDGVAVEVTDADGVMLDGYPMPLSIRVPGEGFNASSVAFNPTGDIPSTNVQAAIEQVQANLIDPLAAFGLGVSGNAPLLANIDASDTPSGMYRYETTTAGTFPSGVMSGDGGAITIWRRNNANAFMTLYVSDSLGVYYRWMFNSAWGAWTSIYRPISTQAQAQAGTDNATDMTPLRVRQAVLSALGATGSAPVFGIRAWGSFNGLSGSVAKRGPGGNFGTVTRTGNGRYQIVFATPMEDANYSVTASSSNQDSSVEIMSPGFTAAGFTIQCNRDDGDQDAEYVFFQVVR